MERLETLPDIDIMLLEMNFKTAIKVALYTKLFGKTFYRDQYAGYVYAKRRGVQCQLMLDENCSTPSSSFFPNGVETNDLSFNEELVNHKPAYNKMIERAIKAYGDRNAAVVVGSAHTAHIVRMCKENGIDYTVVA
ncbi:hypothetical protein HNP86_001952 [Methanococcus maripaludis]|uniref:Uncharacterized protein n=1 Tax=Methanococcus maripaludis TaxID=39152 RepID=A0A7J9NXP6_METMI|nr:hypothetical protein [Methanococcus maripaludis]MBA2851793.1 hypothetical protein [Methanococcus maripaludis]